MLNDHDVLPSVTRRTALQRGAALGGALVWAVPTVQVLGLGAVQAVTSAPPTDEVPNVPAPAGQPQNGTPGGQGVAPAGGGSAEVLGSASKPATPDVAVLPTKTGRTRPPTAAAGGRAGTQASALPRTGAAVSPVDAAVAGAALLAGGVALRRVGRTPAPDVTLDDSPGR